MSNDTTNNNKVLVACATGKCGFQSCLALMDEGYDVYGTTRSDAGAEKLKSIGVTPVVGDYSTDLSRCIVESGAKKLFFITDFFGAAGGDADVEFRQGKQMVDAAASNGVEHAVFVSSECVSDLDSWPKECKHIHAKARVESYLRESSGLACWSAVRPVVFFENLDDPENYNPLTKGSLKFAMTESVTWCSTYDIGRAAAVQFKDPDAWNGKHLNVVGFKGDLDSVADALERAGGFPVKRGLAVPLFLRRFVIGKDLHYMCEFFAGRIANGPGNRSTPAEFKRHVPDAHDAEAWFRHRNKYANGEPIVGNTVPPKSGGLFLPAAVVAVAAVAVVAALAQ